MSLHSLESERNAILNRMQMSRSGFRHMLSDEEDVHDAVADLRDTPPSASPHHPAYVQRQSHQRFPRSTTMKLISEHPFVIAMAVAAVVFIGPRRIVRTALRSGGTMTALTLRNQANIDLISRLLALAGQYLQRSRSTGRSSR